MLTRQLQPARNFSHFLSMALTLAAITLGLSALAHAQTETILFSLLGTTDGHFSRSGVVFDSVGNLYGTTQYGGSGQCFQGCGAVFEISPVAGGGWTETVLHTFTGGSDGGDPGGLAIDKRGVLLGTTYDGGTSNDGTVFALKP
jgi:uncharacterized repeat protein (TIGR03803 family)